MNRMRLPFVLVLVSLLSACASGPHKVTLAPEWEPKTAEVGGGKTVHLTVRDERGRNDLGRLSEDDPKAIVITDQDVADVFRDHITEGLRRNGFAVRSDSGGSRQLKVSLARVERFKDDDEQAAEVAIQVTATNKTGEPGKTYRSEYRGRYTQRGVTGTASASEKMLNRAAASALNRMFEDRSLLRFLSR